MARDETFYFILVREKGHPSVTYARELDEPTDKTFVLDTIIELDGDGHSIECVSAFNPVEGWARDETEDFARTWLDELSAQGHRFDLSIPAFIEAQIGISEAEELRAESEAEVHQAARDRYALAPMAL